ncbi:hypothetical protein M0804_007505 [Polistes exclamans]|nr:hypothetical protein M0804_007505 [Polistes exclamans]
MSAARGAAIQDSQRERGVTEGSCCISTVASQLQTRLFPLTIEVGSISIDGCDVIVLQGEFYETHEIFNRIIDSLHGPKECSPRKFI